MICKVATVQFFFDASDFHRAPFLQRQCEHETLRMYRSNWGGTTQVSVECKPWFCVYIQICLHPCTCVRDVRFHMSVIKSTSGQKRFGNLSALALGKP